MWTTNLLPKDHLLFKSSGRNVFREIVKSKESFLLYTYSDQKIGEKDCYLTTLARHLENQNGEGGPVCGSLYLECSRSQQCLVSSGDHYTGCIIVFAGLLEEESNDFMHLSEM